MLVVRKHWMFLQIIFTLLPATLYATPFTPPDANTKVDEAVYWNQVALELIKKNNIPPPRASRMLGLLHASIFEVVNSTAPKYQSFLIDYQELRNHQASALAAYAAAYVLQSEFKDDATIIGGYLKERNPSLSENIGGHIAKYIVDHNPLQYGSMEEPTLTDGYEWVPTPPAFLPYLLPNWCALKPLGIKSPKQFRKFGPPDPSSEAFTKALAEARLLGELNSTARTPDQTQIAKFWADGKGTVTPPGHWNKIATSIIESKNLSLIDSARVLALLNIAMSDGAIVAWDMKYQFQVARPVTVFGPEGWEPLLTTPPFPEYVSGHSTFSGAAATVLTSVFGPIHFSTTSDDLPGIARSYENFYQAAQEAGKSRIYGGIHYSFSDLDGRRAGSEVGQYILNNYFQPIQNQDWGVN